MIIEPAGHRVLVKPDVVEEQTKGGIYVPEVVRDKELKGSMRGQLVAIGPNAWAAFDSGRPWAAVGDTVLFARYSGVEVRDDDGEVYRVINDEDLVAVVKKADLKEEAK